MSLNNSFLNRRASIFYKRIKHPYANNMFFQIKKHTYIHVIHFNSSKLHTHIYIIHLNNSRLTVCMNALNNMFKNINTKQ